MDKPVTLRWKMFSRQYRPTLLIKVLLLCMLALLTLLLSLSVGKIIITPPNAIKLVLTADESPLGFIVNQLRLPRVVLALLIGCGLAMGGLILQNIVHNPLASPDLMGISAGASAAAVSYLAFFSLFWGSAYLPIAAMCGAGLALLLVFLLSWKRGLTSSSIMLTGVGVSALFTGITTLVLIFSPVTTILSAYVWLAGSVYGANWSQVNTLVSVYLLLLPILIYSARHMVNLQLSDELAAGIGVHIQITRSGFLLICVVLVGAAISVGGAMAFTGLIAPHIARQLVASNHFVALAWLSSLIGAIIVMLADVVARVCFLPADLPAGIFVAAFASPFFLWLLIRQRK